jgi:hypothetical protein
VPSPAFEAEHHAAVGEGQAKPEVAPPPADDDPAFPYDPALAAALKTLRRLNQQATA